MRIETINLVNFRCFSSLHLELKSSLILVYGPNGSGKTSLLEALHYACYLRSFKAHLHRHISGPLADGFSIGLGISGNYGFDTLHVTLKRAKKTVSINGQPVRSYEELSKIYRVVTVKEDDIDIIQGAPSLRRTFIDYMVLLVDPSFAALSKKYKTVLDNRNALFLTAHLDQDSYLLWTQHLLTLSKEIQTKRQEALLWLSEEVNILFTALFPQQSQGISFAYTPSKSYGDTAGITTAEELLERHPSLIHREKAVKKTLFGAHLDDLEISFQQKSSKIYASRGQQKLIMLLLKLAQIAFLKRKDQAVIMLVDDFMADFDEEKLNLLIPLLTTLPSQLILTTPLEGLLKQKLKSYELQEIDLATLPST